MLAMRQIGSAALTARRSSTQADHFCREASFIDEHELRRIEIEFAVDSVMTPPQDVGAILLRSVRERFLNASRSHHNRFIDHRTCSSGVVRMQFRFRPGRSHATQGHGSKG
jgi:hypothetical protein